MLREAFLISVALGTVFVVAMLGYEFGVSWNSFVNNPHTWEVLKLQMRVAGKAFLIFLMALLVVLLVLWIAKSSSEPKIEYGPPPEVAGK